jgi:cytoskeletal protein RodZ
MSATTGSDSRSGIGARLKAGRERSGMTLIQVAERLHVDSRVVEALEADRFNEFDAPVYVKGHLKRYSELVNENTEQILDLYGALTKPAPPDLTQLPKASRHADPRKLVLPSVLVLIAFALIGTVWWIIQNIDPGLPPGPQAATEGRVSTPDSGQAPGDPQATPGDTLTAPGGAETTQNFPGQPGPGERTLGGAGQGATGRSTAVQSAAGPAAQGPAAQGPAGQGPAGQGPAAQGPASQGPASQGPASQGPATQDSGSSSSVARSVPSEAAGPGTATPTAPRVGMAPLTNGRRTQSASTRPLTHPVYGNPPPRAGTTAGATSSTQISKASIKRDAAAATNARTRSVNVTLKFAADSWVEVYDANGQRLFYDIGAANSSHALSGTPPLRVVLGKATGVSLNINGRAATVPASVMQDDGAQFTINRAGRIVRVRPDGG